MSVEGVNELAFALNRIGVGAAPAAVTVTRRFGLMAQAQVRRNMSGRTGVMYQGDADGVPAGEIGPRAITGDLRRSVSMVEHLSGAEIVAVVGSNAVQARRLELGFVGTDSLGRSFDQPPYPAFRPARDKLADEYRAAIIETIGGLL